MMITLFKGGKTNISNHAEEVGLCSNRNGLLCPLRARGFLNVYRFNVSYLLHTTLYSLLITHYLLLIIHYLLLTI